MMCTHIYCAQGSINMCACILCKFAFSGHFIYLSVEFWRLGLDTEENFVSSLCVKYMNSNVFDMVCLSLTRR
jgi:hypothetical protein